MKNIFLAFCCFITLQATAQKDTVVIKLEKKLDSTTNVSDKLDIISKIAMNYNLENPKACQDILSKGIFIAEESRDREMMIKARRIAGNVYAQMASLKEYSEKALSYTKDALELCKKETGVEKEKILCNTQMARLLRNTNTTAEAKKYNEIAMTVAEEFDDDSLLVATKISFGRTQLANGDKLDAFKTFINAQAIAEKSKHKNKDWLEISVYNSLASFYTSIEDYDKAIDYQYKSLNYSKKNNNVDDMFGMLFSIGGNYIAAKKYDAAKNVYTEEIRLADSLKIPDYKTQGLIGIVNTYLSGPEKNKAVQYLKENPAIKEMFSRLNLGYQLDYGMGQVFREIKQYDSAKYYFEKSLPVYEKMSSTFALPGFYQQYAQFLYESGNYNKAITFLNKGVIINDSLENNTANKDFYKALDSCYQKMGDFKNAFYYNGLYEKAKAEADEKSKAKDILAIEIDTENKRKERLEKEEVEITRVRHNWQYMGIVVSILTLFILLATFGIFNVSLKWVRALGFISFIFLFEFIILLADTWIHNFTHGEPWKVLTIKVVLIAMLLPLHHYLEHRVIAYITHKRNVKMGHHDFVVNQQTKPIKLSSKNKE
jgi:tetratricopeptide (TPR) repeat protein